MSTNQYKQYIQALTDFISEERLLMLIDITNSHEKAIELHQQSLKLGVYLMGVIATVEIGLRNSVRLNLDRHFGSAGWLCEYPSTFTWQDNERNKIAEAIDGAKRDKYYKLSSAERIDLDIQAYPTGRPVALSDTQLSRARREHIPISDGNIISKLTLNFWKRLYGDDYEHILWHLRLKRTFPNGSFNRAIIGDNLEIIHKTRNRLAHHEPVLGKRFGEAIKAIIFVSKNLGTDKPGAEGSLATLMVENMREVRKQERVYSKLYKSYL